jgi:hypothetical protein
MHNTKILCYNCDDDNINCDDSNRSDGVVDDDDDDDDDNDNNNVLTQQP